MSTPAPAGVNLASVPPGVDLRDDQRPVLRALMVVMIVLPTLAVVLRFWSRAVLPGVSAAAVRFWWDDWTALLAAILNIVMCGIGFKIANLGAGLHLLVVPIENFSKIMKLLWAEYFIFDTGTTVARASALLFYQRLFGEVQSRFTYAIWVAHILNICWMIGMHFAVGFQCSPVEKLWKPLIPGHCTSTRTLFIASGTPSVIINVFILSLPLPLLWRLKMKLVRKLLIIGVFLCGYMVVVVSIGRLVSIVKVGPNLEKDFTWEFVEPVQWLLSEIAISVFSVCLPSIFVFGRHAYHEGIRALLVNTHAKKSQFPLADSDLSGTYFSRYTKGEENELDRKPLPPPPKEAFTADSRATAYRESPRLPLPTANFSRPPSMGIVVRSDITIS